MKIFMILGLILSSGAAAAIGYRLSGGDLEALVPQEVAAAAQQVTAQIAGQDDAGAADTTPVDVVQGVPAVGGGATDAPQETVLAAAEPQGAPDAPSKPSPIAEFLKTFLNAPSDGETGSSRRNPRRSDIAAMPQAYDRWQRTDYLTGETVDLAWAAIDKRIGKTSNEPVVNKGEKLDGEGTAVLYTSGRQALLIVSDRSPQTHGVAEGTEIRPVQLAGYTFSDVSGDQKKVVDLTLRVSNNFAIRVRGNTSIDTAEEFLKQLDIPGMGGPSPRPAG